MNENAEAWVAELRSGKYEQGDGKLHKITPKGEDQFCCLGVACELYEQKVGGLHPRQMPHRDYEGNIVIGYSTYSGPVPPEHSGDGFAYTLPPEVTEWLGLASDDGSFSDAAPNDLPEESSTSLANLNDSGRTFGEIADTIEEAPEGLFA